MKSIKWIAVFLALLVCLSGCAGTHQSGGSYNIYLIAKSSTTEFWKEAARSGTYISCPVMRM